MLTQNLFVIAPNTQLMTQQQQNNSMTQKENNHNLNTMEKTTHFGRME